MNRVMILLKDVSIGYRGRVVASGLSHTFEAGTLTLLTGRNGSGKSTLLRTIAGIQPALNPTKVSLPFKGEVAAAALAEADGGGSSLPFKGEVAAAALAEADGGGSSLPFKGEVAEGRRGFGGGLVMAKGQRGVGGVFICGQPISSYNNKELARLRAVVQTHYEPVDITVRQVVEMGRTPYTGLTGRLSQEDHAAVQKALAACSLADYAERSFRRLSDGERQRVMIAAALAQDTPIILLDEPTAFLDYEARQQHFQLLRTLADQGKCLICATHDLDMARRYTDQEYNIQL